MVHVTCRLTAKNQDQLRNPTLGNRVWATFIFLLHNIGDWQAQQLVLHRTGRDSMWLQRHSDTLHVVD